MMPADVGMDTVSAICFILMLVSTFALTAIAWVLRLVQYPLLMRAGRSRFTMSAGPMFSVLFIIVGPLMAVELIATLGFAVFLPLPVHRALGWAGLLLLSLVWGVTLHYHRPSVRALSGGFDPAAYRRLLCSQWVRVFAWSFRGVVVILMLTQLLGR